MFHVVLVEPEIPQNTGNIVRTCAATGCTLHLVRPLGFDVSDKALKRAGLDYWHFVDIRYYDCFEEVEKAYPAARFYFFTTKGRKVYSDAAFEEGDFLVFGKETKGLPEELTQDLRQTIIAQRPLKSQKHAVGKCVFEPSKSRCPVSHPLYEQYRMYAFINNIKMQGPGDNKLRALTTEEKQAIIPLFLKKST